tara:strand:- start:579 stop:770 length:192 start_codon:yes stop_codon:yes gene_type:complete
VLGKLDPNSVHVNILKRELHRVERCAAKQGRRMAEQDRVISTQAHMIEKQLKIITGLVNIHRE